MKKSTKLLTTAEFAKLHDVNKRTLHYYDSIGLFSPAEKKGKINIVIMKPHRVWNLNIFGC